MEIANRLAYAVMTGGQERPTQGSWIQTLVLMQSIRSFAGQFAENRILALVPDSEECQAPAVQSRIEALRAEVRTFPADPATLGFPFAAKTLAAGVGEDHMDGSASALMWLDPDTLVLQDPEPLLSGPETDLCYRPVHIASIGSRFDEPLDPFWELIYSRCGAAEGAPFPMHTCVERTRVRPYLNAGSLVVRPELGILRAWSERFARLYRDATTAAFYQRDRRYAIFVHQAVLAGTVLAKVNRARMRELPEFANYYEDPFEAIHWDRLLPPREPLRSWLVARLAEAKSHTTP